MSGRVAFLVAVAMALAGCAHDVATKPPKPFYDNFTEDGTLKEGWLLYQPNPTSSFAIGTDGLLLESSGENGGSDLWLNFGASLLLHPIPPTANWTITTHFFFSPIIDFQAAGLVLTMQPVTLRDRANFTASN